MSDAKDAEASRNIQNVNDYVLNLPRPLNIEEKKYLLAVERGDLPNVKKLLQFANKDKVNFRFQFTENLEVKLKLFSKRFNVIFV